MTRSIEEISERAEKRDIEELKAHAPACRSIDVHTGNDGHKRIAFEFRWTNNARHQRHLVELKDFQIIEYKEYFNCSTVAACIQLLREIPRIAFLVRPYNVNSWETPEDEYGRPYPTPPYKPRRRIRVRRRVSS